MVVFRFAGLKKSKLYQKLRTVIQNRLKGNPLIHVTILNPYLKNLQQSFVFTIFPMNLKSVFQKTKQKLYLSYDFTTYIKFI